MANYEYIETCPSCGERTLNLLNYNSLMVIRHDFGLFGVQCSNCNERVSSFQPIPPELWPEIEKAADEVGAGMGRPNV